MDVVEIDWLFMILAQILFIVFGLLCFGIGFLFFKESPNIMIRLRSSKETREFGKFLMVFGVLIWLGDLFYLLFPNLILAIILLLFTSFFLLLGIFVLIHPGAISTRDDDNKTESWERDTGVLLILVGLFFGFVLIVLWVLGLISAP